ncbi:hypothetical protein L2E82_15952 [Cichorium intybus]|uniref:Uncharacterized protein n=1 Tax=Cichorium intybus TaxID=13427 RepID=A0ACB9F4M7_CICIN|nr:hypothetical protein L2E82_15952 [Cichorium intybus]
MEMSFFFCSAIHLLIYFYLSFHIFCDGITFSFSRVIRDIITLSLFNPSSLEVSKLSPRHPSPSPSL